MSGLESLAKIQLLLCRPLGLEDIQLLRPIKAQRTKPALIILVRFA